jgi:hypothetical protein
LTFRTRFVKLGEKPLKWLKTINKPRKEAEMPSRNLVLGVLLGILGLVIGGCVLYGGGGISGGTAYSYDHPRYCYDCHRYQQWGATVVDCDFYDFYFAGNGYYYRPRHEDRRVFVFRKYNYGKDAKFGDHYRQHQANDEERARIEKEYRGVEKRERQKAEKEYREHDKKVGQRKK